MVMGLQPGLGNAYKVASGDGDAVMKSMMPVVQEASNNFASAAIDVPVMSLESLEL